MMAGARQLARWLAPAIAAAGLCACASISEKLAGTMWEAPIVGVPADAPARPATDTMDFPAVHDMPPQRSTVLLTAIEQKKFEDDLLAARDQQQRMVGTVPSASTDDKKNSKNPNKKETKRQPLPRLPSEPGYIQPASSRTIY
jgi:hypothetical protein